MPSPDAPGESLAAVRKEFHLFYVLGLKFNLHLPHLCDEQTVVRIDILDKGTAARFTGESQSKNGAFRGRHEAVISLNAETGRYEWRVHTELTYAGDEPAALSWIEYTNVYPSGAGRCMLFEPEKRFDCTLMTDADGVVWRFPHQHRLHYKKKSNELNFAEGSLAGFFAEDLNPVVIIEKSSLPPDWAICDMYYDLHCGCRVGTPLETNCIHRWDYVIKNVTAADAEELMKRAKYIPITAEDYRAYEAPRLALGQNDFSDSVAIDEPEEASSFKTDPPIKVWDRTGGPAGKGALRITNEVETETVWSATPPSQIPNLKRFRLTALVKTLDVSGKGMFLRVRYHTFHWRPERHVEWARTLESDVVNGTTDWTRVSVSELIVPEEHFDYLVWIDVVLAGQGTGWLTDVDVDLQSVSAASAVPVEDPAV